MKQAMVGVGIGLITCAVVLAGCGGDDGPGTNPFSEALAESFRSDATNPFTDDQIDCLAVEFVADVGGPSRFEDAGITPDDVRASVDLNQLGLDLTAEDGRAFAESIGQCGISIVEVFLSEAGPTLDDEAKACVEANIDEDALNDYFAATFVETADGPPDELVDPIRPCLGAE